MASKHTVDWELRLGLLIHDVSRMRRIAFDRCLKPLKVTRAQWWLLVCLSRDDGMTQSRLAEELDLGKVAIGVLIDRLEKRGLVRRGADTTDRRVNRIFLETKSKPLIARIRDVAHTLNGQFGAGLTHDELNATAASLRAMKHNLLVYLESTAPGRPKARQSRSQG